jgi:hypothetical protein
MSNHFFFFLHVKIKKFNVAKYAFLIEQGAV